MDIEIKISRGNSSDMVTLANLIRKQIDILKLDCLIEQRGSTNVGIHGNKVELKLSCELLTDRFE